MDHQLSIINYQLKIWRILTTVKKRISSCKSIIVSFRLARNPVPRQGAKYEYIPWMAQKNLS